MKTGRELDALIAEKVMGIEVTEDDFGRRMAHPHNKYQMVLIPRYSTQIADAKLVWEKMQDMGYCIKMFHDMIAWSVCFMHIDGDEKHYADWKSSLEAQICLAALKAVAVRDHI